jgi:hypothetical protein
VEKNLAIYTDHLTHPEIVIHHAPVDVAHPLRAVLRVGRRHYQQGSQCACPLYSEFYRSRQEYNAVMYNAVITHLTQELPSCECFD